MAGAVNMGTQAKTTSKSLRETKRAERQRRQRLARIVLSLAGLIALAIIGYFAWNIFGPKPGQSFPLQPRTHIQVSDPHEPYNSDPPTSGPHAAPVQARFYDEAPADENLVHNLEHGYVILWYNCTGLEDTQCQTLKKQIKDVMDRASPVTIFSSAKKLIAVPRSTMDAQIALTSWGRMQKLTTFDEVEINNFISKLRNQAPEPNVP
jgi:hypothetical protein